MPFVYKKIPSSLIYYWLKARLVIAAALCFILVACANSGGLSKQIPEYAQAKIRPPIQVPDHLSKQSLRTNLLNIPDVPDRHLKGQLVSSVASSIPPVQNVKSADNQVLDIEGLHDQHIFADLGNEQYRMMGANDNKYIRVHLPYVATWQKLVDYWAQTQDNPDSLNIDTGVIEAPWQPIQGSVQPGNFFTRGLSSLFGQDDDKAFYKVRISVIPQTVQDNLLSNNQPHYTQVRLAYTEQSLTQRENNTPADWFNSGTVQEQLLFKLLNDLIDTDSQVQLSTLQKNNNRNLPTTLLGRTRTGIPVAYIQSNPQNAMALLLDTMQAMPMDVGSYDVAKQTIYFTHTSHINIAAKKQANSNDSGGFWHWFKNLHAKDANQSKGIKLFGNNSKATDTSIVYSGQGVQPSKPIALDDRKGHKIKLGDKVLFVFEDDDQGTVNEQGKYEFTEYYQLQLMSNLNGVYVQVLTAQAQPANPVYAEEILANIVQSIVAPSQLSG